MRELDSEFIDLAIELINEAVESPNATWVSLADGAVANSLRPWEVEKSERTNYPVKVVFVTIERDSHEYRKYRFDTETTDGKTLGIFYKTDFEPKIKDILIRDGSELKVLAIDKIAPFKEVIIYIAEFAT